MHAWLCLFLPPEGLQGSDPAAEVQSKPTEGAAAAASPGQEVPPRLPPTAPSQTATGPFQGREGRHHTLRNI